MSKSKDWVARSLDNVCVLQTVASVSEHNKIQLSVLV